MAQTVHLWLTANGTKIDGDSSIASLDREDTIECLQFRDSVRTAREAANGMATGMRSYEPIWLVKRIDKSSPLLAKALSQNEVIEGEFRFYRPNLGSGATEHFFTIQISEGRIASIRRRSPDASDPTTLAEPPTEEVAIIFGRIIWTYEPYGIEHEDHWSNQV